MPRLPAVTGSDPEEWDAVCVRYDERWIEWWGPVGDRVRALEAAGLVRIDRRAGILRDASSGQPLHRLPDGVDGG